MLEDWEALWARALCAHRERYQVPRGAFARCLNADRKPEGRLTTAVSGMRYPLSLSMSGMFLWILYPRIRCAGRDQACLGLAEEFHSPRKMVLLLDGDTLVSPHADAVLDGVLFSRGPIRRGRRSGDSVVEGRIRGAGEVCIKGLAAVVEDGLVFGIGDTVDEFLRIAVQVEFSY